MIALVTALLLSTPQQTWAVGTEREVDEGVYMKVVAAEQGWRVWRIETREGVDCRAYKSARGRRHPVPVGVKSMMARSGTPFLEVFWSSATDKFYSEWHGVHYRARSTYRVPGERFWQDGSPDPTDIPEQVVEVVLKSWEYPEILVGYAEEQAMFDLAGIHWARDQVRSCNEAGVEAQAN